MSYRQLLDKPEYTHKVCGMHPNVAETQQGGEAFAQLLDNIQHALSSSSSSSSSSPSVGLGVGGALSDWWKTKDLTNGADDVIVYLVSDVTNIDSKWMTFVHSRLPAKQKTEIEQTLYKLDATSSSAS
ncbi:hypothetical protein QOT17_003825 [Balamuthia mandrillaris]